MFNSLIDFGQITKTLIFTVLAMLLISLRNPRRPHMVVASNYGGAADPNASAIASYLQSKNVVAFWVSDRPVAGSASWAKRGTFRAVYLTLSAKACFYTHSLSDALPFMHRFPWLIKLASQPKLVFLQHGVLGLKKYLANGVSVQQYIKRLSHTFDFMVVSADWEKQLVANMEVEEGKILATGLPRFDNYKKEMIKTENRVLIFLTWQSESEWMLKMSELVRCKALSRLESMGTQIEFIPHDMQSAVQLDHWQPSSRPISEHVLRSKLLITDESSVAWDFFYAGKQVCFFNPSTENLLEMDIIRERTVVDLEGLERWLESFINNQRSPAPKFAKFSDTGNCQRLISALKFNDGNE